MNLNIQSYLRLKNMDFPTSANELGSSEWLQVSFFNWSFKLKCDDTENEDGTVKELIFCLIKQLRVTGYWPLITASSLCHLTNREIKLRIHLFTEIIIHWHLNLVVQFYPIKPWKKVPKEYTLADSSCTQLVKLNRYKVNVCFRFHYWWCRQKYWYWKTTQTQSKL